MKTCECVLEAALTLPLPAAKKGTMSEVGYRMSDKRVAIPAKAGIQMRRWGYRYGVEGYRANVDWL